MILDEIRCRPTSVNHADLGPRAASAASRTTGSSGSTLVVLDQPVIDRSPLGAPTSNDRSPSLAVNPDVTLEQNT